MSVFDDVPQWRRERGRDRYLRGLPEMASVIGVSKQTVREMIRRGDLEAFRLAAGYSARLDDIKEVMIARYKERANIEETSQITRQLSSVSRERLIWLWLKTDVFGVVRYALHPSHRVAFVLMRPIMIELSKNEFEFTDLGYEIVHALVANDLTRYAKHYRARKAQAYALTKPQRRALRILSYSSSIGAVDLVGTQGVLNSTIKGLHRRGLIIIQYDDNKAGRRYSISDQGRIALQEGKTDAIK